MKMAIRGDDDINALLNEFDVGPSNTNGGASSEVDSSAAKKIQNPLTDPLQTFQQSFILSPPNNPSAEIIRHRIHEKFKSNVYDVIRFCAPSEEPLQSSTENAKRNHYLRTLIRAVWNDMPAHNIWERYQFSLKGLEADCVREMQRSIGRPPWCTSALNVEQLLDPSVRQIYAWIVHGRSQGIVWEPLIPVADICDGESDINQRYKRSAKELLEKEIHFQFRRSFKRCSILTDKKTGRSPKKTLSLDEIYCTIKSFPDHDDNNLQYESDSKMKDNMKKARKKTKDDADKSIKEQFVLQYLFESHIFKKATHKLHKRLQLLYSDRYSDFLKQLKKASDQSLQQQSNKRKKGKQNIPKIMYDNVSTEYETQATVTFGGLTLKINERHMNKLKSMFDTTLCFLGCSDKRGEYFSNSLFTLLLRYDALEGAGLQSAIPSQVFCWMNSTYGCSFECFASPFNCWLKNQQNDVHSVKYGSAFGDTDSIFGSAGSFFDMNFFALAEKERGGCFQANPPFSSNFLESMCSRMHQLLTTDEKMKHIPIMFIIFVPTWKESIGWKALESSPYLAKHVTLLQKEDEHYYAEGTQHRRRLDHKMRKDKNTNAASHRIASFDTSVFFFQNQSARERWRVSDDDINKLKLAFAMKFQEDEIVGTSKSQRKPSQQPQTKGTQHPEKEQDGHKTSTLVFKQSKQKKQKRITGEQKKQSRLLEGGKDEMDILASLGLASESSPKKCKNSPSCATDSSNNQKMKGRHGN